ncbi:phospholipase-like protein [Tanacetum coccineum]
MDKEASPPTVTIKAKIDVVKVIREALTPTQVEIFEKTCFGHWLDVGLKKNSQLLIHTLLTCMVDGKANELSFLVLGKRIYFRRQEFCLVTGLRFGCNMYMKKWVENLTDNPFRNRMVPHIEAKVSVKLSDVLDIFDKMRKRSLALEDNDAVRICLLVLLEHGFLGHQLSHNVFDDMLKLIWIFEAIPATHRYVHKQPTEKILRALAWELRIPFSWEDMYNIMKKISDATGVVENIESNEYFCYFQKPNCDLNVGLQQLWTEEDYMDLYMYIGHGKTQFLHIYIVKEEINEECEACRASSSAESEGIVII